MPWTWMQLQQEWELFLVRIRYVCAGAVPVFYAINQIWHFFDDQTASKIVGTFVALGFLTVVRGTRYTPAKDADVSVQQPLAVPHKEIGGPP